MSSETPNSTSLYPQPDSNSSDSPSEELLLRVPGAIVHLIDKTQSVELAHGDLELVRLIQNGAVLAVLARIGEQIQWPLAKDEPSVKLDTSHYFFSLSDPDDSMLNYGLTVPAKGVAELDGILAEYSRFSVEKVEAAELCTWWRISEETAPAAAYWTTLAPNVEDYSSGAARAIAAGSGKVVKGVLWCGDVTVERLNWGNEFLKKKMDNNSNSKVVSQVSPEVMMRIQRVKKITKMSEEIAAGILSGVVKVTGYVTAAIVNSNPGRKFFTILPGEIVLATLDGYNKFWDAVEVAGKNVMSTSSVVTTELVSDRYGEHAARATNQGLGAAGHAVGAAWAVFKITKAFNPKSIIKPTALAKAAKTPSSSSHTKPAQHN